MSAALANWTDIANQYKQLADQLIETVNATTLRIEYKSPVANQGADFNNNLSEDNIGNPNYIENIFGRMDQSGKIKDSPLFDEIKCRSYWNSKDMNFPIPFNNDPDVCRLVIYVADTVKLLNSSFLYVDGVKCKMVRIPVPYGFGKIYSEAYVKKVGSIIDG